MLKVEHITLVKDGNLCKELCGSVNLIVGSNNVGKTTFLNNLAEEVKGLHARPFINGWTYGVKLKLENAEKDIKKVFPNLVNRTEHFINFDEVNENIFVDGEDQLHWSQPAYDYLRKATNKDFEFESTYIHTERDNDLYQLFSFLTRIFTKVEHCVNRLDTKFHTTITTLNSNTTNDFIFHLYKNRKIFAEIQKNIKEVYGKTIDFDNLQQGYKPLRIVKKTINKKIKDPFILSKEWNKGTDLLDSVGHGIRAYLQLVFSILHPSNRIILIDEPEMFIHPPQRRALGKLISLIAKRENKQVFVATHDSEFMRGVLSESNDVRIFRLFNEKETHFYKTISSNEILSLITKQASNLLNERILNSFFYKKTILCENEHDRVFYEESTAEYHWSKFHDINFIGFNGKDMAIVVYNKLIALEVKPAVILDIDYLVQGQFPNIDDKVLKKRYVNLQKDFKKLSFCNKEPEYLRFKKIGINLLRTKKYLTMAQEVKFVINEFKRYQIYIVPVGEFESWTRSDKNDIPNALTKMRERKISSLVNFLSLVIKQ